jgi:hypothetical protein
VWVDGEEYPADAASGEAVIPFAASRGGVHPAVLIAADDFAALTTLELQSESYSLAAGAQCIGVHVFWARTLSSALESEGRALAW